MSVQPSERLDVLIVGAGPTGLAAALALAREGVLVRIIDRDASPGTFSPAVVVHPRMREILDHYGLGQAFEERGQRIEALQLSAGGQVLLTQDLEEVASPFRYMLNMPSGDIATVLRENLAALGVEVEPGWELRRLDLDSSTPRVLLARDDDTSVLTPRFVIGADGSHSRVRQLARIPFIPDGPALHWLTADLTVHWNLAPVANHVFCHRDGVCIVLPLPGGLWRVVFALPDVQALQKGVDIDHLLAERTGQRPRLERVHWSRLYPVQPGMAERYWHQQVVLLGDAAHTFSLCGNQGLNMGVQAVANLSWKLAGVIRGDYGSGLLASYEEERQFAARQTLRFTSHLEEVGGTRNPLIRALRNVGLPALAGSEWFQRSVINQLASTRQMAVEALEEAAGGSPRRGYLQPGQRLPDYMLEAEGQAGSSRPLSNFLDGRHWTLFATTSDSTPAAREALSEFLGQKWPPWLRLVVVRAPEVGPLYLSAPVFVDSQRRLCQGGAPGLGALLIRPEGYVVYHQPGLEIDTLRSLLRHLAAA